MKQLIKNEFEIKSAVFLAVCLTLTFIDSSTYHTFACAGLVFVFYHASAIRRKHLGPAILLTAAGIVVFCTDWHGYFSFESAVAYLAVYLPEPHSSALQA